MNIPRLLPVPQESRAVLVGTHHYSCLENLPAVRQNLARLSDRLCYQTVWVLARQDCIVLEQPQDQKSVLSVVEDAAKSATDTLLIYYAGHGLPDLNDGTALYLAFPDSSPDRLW